MAEQTRFPGTGVNDASIGTNAWDLTPEEIVSDNDVRAGTGNLNNGEITNYLKGTNFGFTLPSDAVVDGIQLEIEKYASGAGNATVDYEVKLVNPDGTIWTTNKADTTTVWAGAAPGASAFYGSVIDTWGKSWTGADINDADFGAVLAATNPNANNAALRVDFFRIRVRYHQYGGSVIVPTFDPTGVLG